MLTIQNLRDSGSILFECISGSRSQGLATETSDTDIKGVYILPKEIYFGFQYIPQISEDNNNVVFYEIGRFLELALKNNPNILEMIGVDEKYILHRHSLFERIKPEIFLSKLCRDTFGRYAMGQITRARGLNKKILNPLDKEKKSPLDFCYIAEKERSMPLRQWLVKNEINDQRCGLVDIPHMAQVYALYYDENNSLSGLFGPGDSHQLITSSVPQDLDHIAYLYYNKDGYSAYCKDYKEYWSWVDKRNEDRYKNTIAHGKNYDAKNVMHTFRLLNMAVEILRDGKLFVERGDRDELLKIKSGYYDFNDLMTKATDLLTLVDELYVKSTLAEEPDGDLVEKLLVDIRKSFYI